MIKVLYILHTGKEGGSSTAFANMLDALASEVSPFVVAPSEGSLTKQLEQRGIPVKILEYEMNLLPDRLSLLAPLRLVKRILRNRRARRQLNEIIRAFRPDLIHTNVGPVTIGYLAAKSNHIPHVWHLREYLDLDFDMHPYPSMAKQITRYKDNEGNHCITITKGVREHFDLSPGQATVVYDGVVDGASVAPKPKKNYLLFAGRLEDAKGIKPLLKAFVEYRRRGGNLNLKVAGSGSDSYLKECLAIVAGTEAEDAVEFPGYRTDVDNLMAQARALVVPSRFEGFGFITTEAMHNNCLVIGRDTAGTKEQFDNGLQLTGKEIGWRFTDDSQLPQLMLKVEQQHDIDIDDTLQRAAAVVNKLYTKQQHAQGVLSVYNKLPATK